MAYDGWIEFNGTEIVNISRTSQLAGALGIDVVWVSPSSVQWIEDELGGVDYDVVTTAPWYDEDYPASAEFAGIMPLGFPGLDDSTTTAETIEYIGDGGRSGVQRNTTLPIVASVALVASSDRGAEYGKRWLDRILRAAEGRAFCAGSDLRYFRYAGAGAPVAHRREVHLTRAASITRKRSVECSVTWLATFTLTCDDPYEYGEAEEALTSLGAAAPVGAINYGSLALVQSSCPVYDYTPIYDPLYPALVPSPTVPDYYPAGWNIEDGMSFTRYWARILPVEPSTLNVVPVIELTASTEARRVRVSIWPGDSPTNDQCDPLFSTVVSYLPAGHPLYIDAEQRASFIDSGLTLRRADSLVYSPDAKPVQWAAFNDNDNLLVTLDIFTDTGTPEGGGTVRAALSLVPKSD